MNIKRKLSQFLFLKEVYHSLTQKYYSLSSNIMELYYRKMGVKFVFSNFARINNFGDIFNYDLINFFGYKLLHTLNVDKSDVAILGSILQMYHRKFNGYILGSGFIDERYNRIPNDWKIKLVRGPLSLAQCTSTDCDIEFGDPGILVNLIYTEKVAKKYKLGILPHTHDYTEFKDKFGKEYKVINAKKNPRKVANEIKQCHHIASSSLHGLIFSDAFQIPNVHIKFGNNLLGGHHKFKDYYCGMGLTTYDFIDYNTTMQMDEIISQCKTRFTKNEISAKQYQIISIYKEFLPLIAAKNV